MSRKTTITLAGCLTFSTVTIAILYFLSNKVVREPNSFLRIYRNPVIQSETIELKINSYYVAGEAENWIYLGNYTAPSQVLALNKHTADTLHITLRIKNTARPTIHSGSTIKISAPYFFIADGLEPALYRGLINKWDAERFPYDKTAYFTELVPISNTSFGIRTLEAHTREHMLGKVQPDTPFVQLKPGLLQKQIDGIFCTDGQLVYNPYITTLVYTYYYRNEFIVYDTNLNLKYRGHTIDTFSRAQIKIGYITSTKSKQVLERKVINLRSRVWRNYLFIQSNLLAKNDPKNWMRKNTVFDVYNLKRNTYELSFILPRYGDNGVHDFIVFEDGIVVLHEKYATKFIIQPGYFDRDQFKNETNSEILLSSKPH